MPKLTIDGQEIEVEAGTTVLQAALSVGQEVPHYCYHPGLSIAGNCRMCLVEMDKAPKLVIACATQVTDGMVIRTNNERVKQAQAAIMEFLLLNHPLDCPICDQAGECKLQDYAVEYGTGITRSVEPKVLQAKAVDIGRHITLDQERCIQCSRCIRFCDEVTETGELAFFQRGEKTIIGTYPGRRLDNPYSGNVVDICPVGALTLKEFRFQTRVWYLRNTPSICAGCSRGCNVMVSTGSQQVLMTTSGQLDDRIKRLVPRVNMEVNGHWMCDEGRLSFLPLNRSERLRCARGVGGAEISWDDAVKQAARKLQAAGESGRGAAILSPRWSSESLFAFKQLLESLDIVVGMQRIVRGSDDGLLVLADKGANSRGASWIFGASAAGGEAIAQAVTGGKIDTLLVLGDNLDPADTMELSPEVRESLGELIFVGPFLGELARQATLVLPVPAWSEEDGTLVNAEGRVQRLGRAHVPRGAGRPGWRLAADIGAACGFEAPAWKAWDDVLRDLAATVPELEGLDPEAIGLLGVEAPSAVTGGTRGADAPPGR